MPLVQRKISHPLEYPDPKLYVQSPPHEILADVHFASMVGVLKQVTDIMAVTVHIQDIMSRMPCQLGQLSAFATSIFKVE